MGDLIVLYQVSQIILTTKIISESSFFPDISTLIDYSEEFHKSYQNMFICGGESIYKYFIDNNRLDSMIVTEIDDDRNLENDIKFPLFNNFSCVSSQLYEEIPAKYIPENKSIFLNYTANHLRS